MSVLTRSVLSSAALLLLCTASSSGQKSTSPSNAVATADPFAAESFVIQRQDSVFSYNADGTGYRESTLAITVQSEAALRNFGVVAIAFASNSEKVEFHYVRVRRHDGTVVETPLSQAIEQPEEVTREAPFYSDLKQEQIPVKSLGVGDTLEWQARVIRTHAEAPGEFWGQDSFVDSGDAVVRESSIELHVPKAKPVTVWTNPRWLATLGSTLRTGNSSEPTDTTVGDQRVLRWEFSSLKPTAGKTAEAEKEAKKKVLLTADEELDNERGKLPTVAWTTFPSWAAVGAWYRGLQGDRMEPNAEIKSRVGELTAGKSTDEDKVRAVYAFASSQIRYIGVAFGVGRYQPHRAEDVLSNQYGDCKDKETLLASMLAVLGFHTDAVLIGAGIRFNPAVPSPAAFNHLIARVLVDGHEVWLDPTAEVAPYRMLYAVLRDREALVIPEIGAATIQHTPLELPFAAAEEWKAVGSLDTTGTSESHITLTLRGDNELLFRTSMRQVPPSSYNELSQKLVQGFGYAGTPSHAEFSRPEETADPWSFSFDYHREHNGDWDNHRIVPQLAPLYLPMVDEKEPPVAPIDLLAPRTEHSIAELKLPEGWSAELPEAVHQKAAWASYDRTYRLEKGTLTTERTLKVLQQKVPASDWQAYKKWQDSIGLGKEDFIQLVRPAASPGKPSKKASAKSFEPEKSESLPAPSSAANVAEQRQVLLGKLEAAYNLRDLDTLQTSLQALRALGPDARRVHAWAGSLYILNGDMQQALAETRKELELYPDETDRYESLVFIQTRLRDKPGVMATMQAWAKAAPDDPKPWGGLATALLSEKHYTEALEDAQHAVAHAPSGTEYGDRSRLLLGKVQLQLGKTAEADATLTDLLQTTTAPGMQNDAAYELANAGLELPLAEEKARAALGSLTAETKAWTGNESPTVLRQKSSLLAAAWDTLGWILFKEGKSKEAQTFIAASWTNRMHADVRGHLEKVQSVLGPDFAQTPESLDLHREEQAVRTISLGPAGSRKGVAEYRLLLGANRVENAIPETEKTLPNADALLRSAHLTHLFPEDAAAAGAQLVRWAMLNCHGEVCELVFNP